MLKKRMLDETDLEFKALIKKYMDKYNIEDKEMAIKLRIGISTYREKKADPGRFRRSEQKKIFEILHFTEADQIAVIFGQETLEKYVARLYKLASVS